MGKDIRLKRRAALWLFFLLAVPAIDQGFGASFKDGDKGQPEMVQPLDNHPMEWTVDGKDDTGTAIAANSYRYLLMQRTNDLLTEALGMLERVRDGRSRRWLEAFIYKMGELAVQLGGKQYQRKAEISTYAPSQVVPTSRPTTTTMTSMKIGKAAVENQVTSTQLNHVLPANEAIMNRQVVTNPGVAETAFEDELVRQLHDQERLSKQEAKNNMKAPNSSEPPQLPESIRNDINNLPVKDDEKQLLMDLANELNELSDLDGGEQQIKGNQKAAELANLKTSESQRQTLNDKENEHQGEDQPNGAPDYGSYGEVQNSGFYFPRATAPPETLREHIPPAKKTYKSPVQYTQPTKPKNLSEKQNQSSQYLGHPNWVLPQTTNARNPAVAPAHQLFRPVQIQQNNNAYGMNPNRPHDMQQFTQDGRFKKQNTAPYQYPIQEQSVKAPVNLQNKPRHPILQEMLLASHGHNSPYMHLSSPRVATDTYRVQVAPKVYNQTSLEPRTYQNGNLNDRNFQQQSEVNMKHEIPQPQLRSVNQGLNLDTIPGEIVKGQQNTQWNRLPETGNMNDFHFDQVSFPNQLGSNPQLQHNMERQLRAGKVVILSDSLVKTNFNRNATKVDPTKAEGDPILSAQAQDALNYKNGEEN